MKTEQFYNYMETFNMKWLKTNTLIMALLAALIVNFAACDLLEVDNPSSLTEDDLDQASQLDFLLNSAAGNIGTAYPRVILANGLISDDLMPGSSQTAYKRLDEGFFDIFTDDVRPFDLNNTYNQVSQARWVANLTTTKIRNLATDSDDIRIAKAETYEAFALLLLAENWERATFDGESPIPDTDVYQLVLAKLNDALTIAQASSDAFAANILGLLARTNYSMYAETGTTSYLNTAAGFAQQALAISNNFILNAIYSSSQSNYVWSSMNNNTLPVTPEYPFLDRKDIFSGNDEPRAQNGPWKMDNPDGNPVHDQLKYPDRDSPIPIVKWQEMNLILAENELEKGTPDIAAALTYMNKNRAEAGLPDMATADINEALDFLIYERATEFWLEGRRWMDMRHFDIPFTRWAPESVNAGANRKWDIGYTEQITNPNF